MRSKFEIMRTNRGRALRQASGSWWLPSVQRDAAWYARQALPEARREQVGLGARCLELAPADQREQAELNMAALQRANVGVEGSKQGNGNLVGRHALRDLAMRVRKLGQKLAQLFRRQVR